MNNFILRLKEIIFAYGRKWDKLVPKRHEIDKFVLEKLNKGLPSELLDFSKNNSIEHYIIHHSEKINKSLRYYSRDIIGEEAFNKLPDNTIELGEKYSKYIKKYSIKDDIVVYRRVPDDVMNKTLNAAINIR